ncbi:cytochrome c1 [Alphaproteobacteria bacterium]|nr:cytochrome c1 [Alphaproteobacteria bacterium]MDB2393473.1 cytochrome c1 [Alphaproteobacteria bacterium]MDB2432352.1 cytochrome c1 [Alphaproteobacteria bacterium]MDB2487547.1 cytochrome c1 [Alphaproteobacteria bacterium]MDB2641072.1 cytochrome c1 [Alphaproteobacteria bacterium]
MMRFGIKAGLAAAIMAVGLSAAVFTPANAAGDAKHPAEMNWQFDGLFGTYDRNALRRGFQVYKEVCASCHSLNQIAFRNLSQEGGPEFSEAEVKAIAKEYLVEDGPDDYGDMFERDALPRDKFPSPYPNENAARAANGGAYPPDLSLITKARGGGADYIHALLSGYEEAPEGVEMRAGLYYNPYMAGGKIAMPVPLLEELVEYSDGTEATVEQMSMDVTHFLNWTAEPELEQRKRMGFMVLIYLSIFAGLMFFSMRKIWADLH